MKTEPCPICAEWRYKSLVAICPICGEKGGLEEVDDLASDFLRLWQTGTFEQMWDAIRPAAYGTQTQAASE